MNYLFSNKDLRKLIVPLIFERALDITVGMADTIMVSSLGEAAVSGVSLVDMINVLLSHILSALATGGAVVTSQYIGAKKIKESRHSAKQLLYTALMFGLVIAAASYFARRPLLGLFFGSIEADVMENALIYLVISVISYPFLAVYNACAALFRSMGNSRITLKVSILINIINVTGNAFCIFVLKMGVAGVALPSLISRAVGAMVLYNLLRNPKHLIHFEKGPFSPDWAMIKSILHIGIPSGIENGLFQLGRVLVVSIISGFGTIQIAANGVANNIDTVSVIIGSAMNLAIITVIGQCVGANDERQIHYYTKKMLFITYAGTWLLNICVFVLLNPLLNLYGLSADTLNLARILILMHMVSAVIIWPLAFVLPNMLRACNDVKYTMAVSIFSMFAFRIAFSYLLGVRMGMGAIGVWIGMIIDWVFRLILFVSRYFSGRWKKLCLTAKPDP